MRVEVWVLQTLWDADDDDLGGTRGKSRRHENIVTAIVQACWYSAVVWTSISCAGMMHSSGVLPEKLDTLVRRSDPSQRD